MGYNVINLEMLNRFKRLLKLINDALKDNQVFINLKEESNYSNNEYIHFEILNRVMLEFNQISFSIDSLIDIYALYNNYLTETYNESVIDISHIAEDRAADLNIAISDNFERIKNSSNNIVVIRDKSKHDFFLEEKSFLKYIFYFANLIKVYCDFIIDNFKTEDDNIIDELSDIKYIIRLYDKSTDEQKKNNEKFQELFEGKEISSKFQKLSEREEKLVKKRKDKFSQLTNIELNYSLNFLSDYKALLTTLRANKLVDSIYFRKMYEYYEKCNIDELREISTEELRKVVVDFNMICMNYYNSVKKSIINRVISVKLRQRIAFTEILVTVLKNIINCIDEHDNEMKRLDDV